MSFIKKKEMDILKLLNGLSYDIESVKLVPSGRPEFGMYQFNDCMMLAKKYGKNPRDIANEIVEVLKQDSELVNINIQGPGFINLSFSNESLIKYMNDMLKDVKCGINNYDSKKIVLDYGGANVAKVLHVGHLRSANIGEALNRLLKLVGMETISDVHLGDYGRQMGMIILEIRNRFPDLPCFRDDYNGENYEVPITNKDLETIYPIANEKAKNDPIVMEEARDITNLLQKGHLGYVSLWHHIVDISVKDIKKLYDMIGAKFDYWYGESDASSFIPELTDYLKSRDVLEYSEGATVINVSNDDDKKEIPPLLYIKSNGSISYEATDLATIYQRMKEFNPDEIWYVVDNRQELHFTQTFRASKKSSIVNDNTNLEFLGFGTMNGKDGKPFKTRDGGVMSLSKLINIVKEKCLALVSEDIEDKESVGLKVALGALKYADLLPSRSKDYIFDVDKFCDVQGKTGPYIMYSSVRINSLINKCEVSDYKIHGIYNEYDMNVIINLLDLARVIDNCIMSKSLNDLCEYLYRLNNSYNSFYNEIKILSEEDNNKRVSWISLSKLVLDVNKMLLDVLAIEIPERM